MKKVLLLLMLIATLFVTTACGGSSYSSSSYSSSSKGYGGYDMPNSGDKSFVDYMKRVDPGLYNSLIGN